MTGVKGAGGPVPKRSEHRRRKNAPAKGAPTKADAAAPYRPPSADRKWHPVARRWFEALAKSGQAQFYEPSDWATAYVLAESMSREFSPQPLVVGAGKDSTIEMVTLPPKGASLAAWLKGMTSLLATEGDRRRAALELQQPAAAAEEVGGVSELDEYRRRLGGSAS